MVSTQTADAQHICPRCTEVATKLCGGCKEIGYCSLECQQADWPVQKNLCKSFQDFAGPRPAPEMRRVVVFHPEEKKPRFMWAPLLHDEWGWGCGRVCPADLLDYHSNNITWKALETRKNIWTGKDLGYAIQMWFDDNWCNNFSDTNYAVVATTQDQDPAKWSGPIVVTCQTLARGRIDFSGNSVRSNEMLDMDLLAYSHLAGFMVDFYNDSQSHSFRKGPKVQCVEMACGQGDNSTEVHSLVHVPRSHPMFQGRGVLSEISKQLQEPLITWEVPKKTSNRQFNPKIVSLHICCDPTLRKGSSNNVDMPHFGFAPKRYLLDVGTHLVARADGQPLTGETVDTMASFCRFYLLAYFEKCSEDSSVEYFDEMSPSRFKLRQEVMDQITPEKWKTYLAQWKAEKIDKSEAESHGRRVYTIGKARAGVERMGLTEDDYKRLSGISFNLRDLDLENYKLKYGED